MSLPVVIEYHARPIRPNVRRECLCVECGATRPIFRIPTRHVCTGLKPLLYAAEAIRLGVRLPDVIHEPLAFDKPGE